MHVDTHIQTSFTYLTDTCSAKIRIQKLAKDIREDYADTTIHLLCVLKGGSAYFQDLIAALRRFHDYSDQVRTKVEGIKSDSHEEIFALLSHTCLLSPSRYLNKDSEMWEKERGDGHLC